jgi:hypothetical protein
MKDAIKLGKTSFQSRWFSVGYLGSRSALLRVIIPSKDDTKNFFSGSVNELTYHVAYKCCDFYNFVCDST